jgi:polyisoprenoid-binding protein YceI
MGLPSDECIRPGRWTIDPARSEVGFSVRHLMVATVRGRFGAFEGTIKSDAVGLIGATGVVHTASIDTGERKRDERLRSESFLDVERVPLISFASRRIEPRNGEGFRVVGDLTMAGVARELALDAVLRNGTGDGDLRLEAHGALRRSDFGLSWRESLEAAGALVSDRVGIAVEVVARRAASNGG